MYKQHTKCEDFFSRDSLIFAKIFFSRKSYRRDSLQIDENEYILAYPVEVKKIFICYYRFDKINNLNLLLN